MFYPTVTALQKPQNLTDVPASCLLSSDDPVKRS